MAAHSLSNHLESASQTKLDILGLAFFLMGAPHIYSVLRQRQRRQHRPVMPRYLSVVLLAMTIAGVLEICVF